MKEVVVISNPDRRQVWENMLGIAHFHLYTTYPITLLLKPEEAKKAIDDDKVDIVLADIRDLQNKKPDIKQKYLDCVVELAKQIGLSNQKNIIKKRLAIFLPTKLDKQVSQMIINAFSYNVYDFFKMHYDHGKNSINLESLSDQLNKEPDMVNGNKYVEMAHKVINGENIPTLEDLVPEPTSSLDEQSTDDIVNSFTQQLKPKDEEKDNKQGLNKDNVPTSKESVQEQVQETPAVEPAPSVKQEQPATEESKEAPVQPSSKESDNISDNQADLEPSQKVSPQDLMNMLNSSGPVRSAAISAFAKDKKEEPSKPRVHKRRRSTDTSQYDSPAQAEPETTSKEKKAPVVKPWNKQFDTNQSRKEKEQAEKQAAEVAKQLEQEQASTDAFNDEPEKPKRVKKKKVVKQKPKQPKKKKKSQKKSPARWLIPIIILVGIALLFFSTQMSNKSSDNNQQQATEKSTSKRSLNSYLEESDYAGAVKAYPDKTKKIDDYIINNEQISNKKADINEVYKAADSSTPTLDFDHAYFNHKWETVVNNADVADSVQREVMLSAAYLAIGDTQDAQKVANKVNQPSLTELVQKYTNLINTDNQIKSQLNQSGLDNNKRQQLQQTLNDNQKTINEIIDELG